MSTRRRGGLGRRIPGRRLFAPPSCPEGTLTSPPARGTASAEAGAGLRHPSNLGGEQGGFPLHRPRSRPPHLHFGARGAGPLVLPLPSSCLMVNLSVLQTDNPGLPVSIFRLPRRAARPLGYAGTKKFPKGGSATRELGTVWREVKEGANSLLPPPSHF